MEASYILFQNYFCINESVIASHSPNAVNENAKKILLIYFPQLH